MRKPFTNSYLQTLKPRVQRYQERDVTGLIVRVETSGTVSFWSRYELHGRERLVKHGKYGHSGMSLAKAREAHTRTLAEVERARRGESADPAVQRDVKREEARAGDTVSDFAEVYLERYAKPKKRSWETDERILDSDVLPYIGSYKLKDLTRAQIQAVLDRIDDRGAHNQAWQTLKVVRKMLNYARSRGAIEANPAEGIEREVTYQATQRALSDAELVGLFSALPELHMQGAVSELLLFQLLTAVRPSEARLACWNEIDTELCRWLIPEARMKANKPHLVPLSGAALQLLERMRAFGEDGYVFPGEKEAHPFNLQALGHALRRQVNKEVLTQHGVAFFTPHDIRRTAATIMRRLGFGLVVDRVLAHAPQSVLDRHYDTHDYEPEKRAALEGLARYVLALQARSRGENVQTLAFRQ